RLDILARRLFKRTISAKQARVWASEKKFNPSCEENIKILKQNHSESFGSGVARFGVFGSWLYDLTPLICSVLCGLLHRWNGYHGLLGWQIVKRITSTGFDDAFFQLRKKLETAVSALFHRARTKECSHHLMFTWLQPDCNV